MDGNVHWRDYPCKYIDHHINNLLSSSNPNAATIPLPVLAGRVVSVYVRIHRIHNIFGIQIFPLLEWGSIGVAVSPFRSACWCEQERDVYRNKGFRVLVCLGGIRGLTKRISGVYDRMDRLTQCELLSHTNAVAFVCCQQSMKGRLYPSAFKRVFICRTHDQPIKHGPFNVCIRNYFGLSTKVRIEREILTQTRCTPCDDARPKMHPLR